MRRIFYLYFLNSGFLKNLEYFEILILLFQYMLSLIFIKIYFDAGICEKRCLKNGTYKKRNLKDKITMQMPVLIC